MVREYKKKVVQEVEEVVEYSIWCDECKEPIYHSKLDPNNQVQYFRATSGHNDWHRDSVDSIKGYDFCCVRCAENAMVRFFEKEEPYSNTAYFNIEATLSRRLKYHEQIYSERS